MSTVTPGELQDTRIMNPQETQQVIARDEKWVPSTEKVKISPTNVRLETTVHQKEETFQVIINVIKNSTCFKAFTISAEVPEIFMQQFWYTIKKESIKVSNESEPQPTKKKTDSRSTRGVVIQDTLSAPKPKLAALNLKLKGVQSLTLEEQEAADNMQALKESKKTSRRQSYIGGSSEGTGRIPKVPSEYTVVSTTSSEGTCTKLGVPDEENVTLEENVILEWGFEHENTDDEDAKTESDDDEIYKYKIQVHKDVDVEMVGDETNKEKDELTDAAKADVEKTTEEKGDAELAGNVMNSDYQVKVNKLFDGCSYPTRNFTIQSPLVLKVPVSVISKTTPLPPIPKIPTKTPVSIALSPLHVTPTISIVQQTTASIPTPPITTKAPTITTDVFESDALTARHTADRIQKYFVKPTPELSKTRKPTIDLIPKSDKSASKIHKIKKEQAKKQNMPKYTIKSTDKATLKEYDLKSALYQTMNENKSFNKNPANHALYHAFIEALIEGKNAMDKGVADIVKNHKRQDDDEDPSAGPNHGKKTKRRRTKESESSMKPSTTKETSKGKPPSKSSKTGKSATTMEPIKEPIVEMVMDDLKTNANEDVVNDADRPQDDVAPRTNKPFRDT
nr:hypothetical protein [Tanacetum cinerariifolium]